MWHLHNWMRYSHPIEKHMIDIIKRNKQFFFTIVSFLFVSCNSSSYLNEKKGPNIIWLVAEDLGPYIPSFGDSTVSTPNLDRLAREGVCYTNVYSVSGVCAPSRSAIATGMYPSSIGAHHMRTLSQQPAAKEKGISYKTGVFPWSASGKAIAVGKPEGKTKILFDPDTNIILGGGIVGANAGDLISEIVLAIEMGADAIDLALSIHPHPTFSETAANAAEMYLGTITDLYVPRKK